MADLTDVENALVIVAQVALYPNGNPQPGQIKAPSVTGDSVRIFPGWPKSKALEDDLKAGNVNISVFAPPGSEHNTSRFPKDWQESIAPVTTVTATAQGNQVTIGGVIGGMQYVTVLIGSRKVYSYEITSNDDMDSVASNIAALINADFPASAAGPVITIDTSASVIARVGTTGTSWRELRRQERLFKVSIWAPTVDARVRVSKIVDVAFAKVEFLTMPDNSAARLIYAGTAETDEAQRIQLYRRDLSFTVEYATSETKADFEITSFSQNVQGGVNPSDAPIQVIHTDLLPTTATNE
jgi:hypothetical protein